MIPTQCHPSLVFSPSSSHTFAADWFWGHRTHLSRTPGKIRVSSRPSVRYTDRYPDATSNSVYCQICSRDTTFFKITLHAAQQNQQMHFPAELNTTQKLKSFMTWKSLYVYSKIYSARAYTVATYKRKRGKRKRTHYLLIIKCGLPYPLISRPQKVYQNACDIFIDSKSTCDKSPIRHSALKAVQIRVIHLIEQQRILAQGSQKSRLILHLSREPNSLPRPVPPRPWHRLSLRGPGPRARSHFPTTFSSPRSWEVRIDMKHPFKPIWGIRHGTHTINDHTRWNRIRQLARGGHAHGITPSHPWHHRWPDVILIVTLTTIIPASVCPSDGSGTGSRKMIEKCSRRDMDLKLFLAPVDRTRGDAHDDQTLMWVRVERWSCGSGSSSGCDAAIIPQATPVRKRSCCYR